MVPDKWSPMYCSEYFNVFEHLVWTSHEIKKVGGILAKPAPKKGKTITTETLRLLTKVYEDDNFNFLKRNTTLVLVKEYINKNFATSKSICNSQELDTIFKEKVLNVNIGFSKFCVLRHKWCVLAGSNITCSVCVCNAHQNVVLLVDAMDWGLIYKDLIKKTVYNPESSMHRFESCPGTTTLKKFLDQKLNKHESDEKFNYCQWDTTDQAIFTTFTAIYK